MSVDQVSVDQVSIDQVSVDRMCGVEMSVDQKSVDQLCMRRSIEIWASERQFKKRILSQQPVAERLSILVSAF